MSRAALPLAVLLTAAGCDPVVRSVGERPQEEASTGPEADPTDEDPAPEGSARTVAEVVLPGVAVRRLVARPDGGYIVGGLLLENSSFPSGPIWLGAFSPVLVREWTIQVPSDYDDQLHDVVAADDGSIYTSSSRGLIRRYGSNATLQWERIVAPDPLLPLAAAPDGGIFVFDQTDLWHFDAAGNEVARRKSWDTPPGRVAAMTRGPAVAPLVLAGFDYDGVNRALWLDAQFEVVVDVVLPAPSCPISGPTPDHWVVGMTPMPDGVTAFRWCATANTHDAIHVAMDGTIGAPLPIPAGHSAFAARADDDWLATDFSCSTCDAIVRASPDTVGWDAQIPGCLLAFGAALALPQGQAAIAMQCGDDPNLHATQSVIRILAPPA